MADQPRPKLPIVCFGILAATLLLGGLGSIGAFILLVGYYPKPNSMHAAMMLAINGLLSWILAATCGLAVWKLFKQRPTANSLARKVWVFAAAFTLWTLLVDGYLGWSRGGIAEVVVWSFLESLIGLHLLSARRRAAD